MSDPLKTIDIKFAVGEGGQFQPADVAKVVMMLKTVPPEEGGTPSLTNSPSQLVAAIRKFQLWEFAVTTGRIDPGGSTIGALNHYYYRSQGQDEPMVFDKLVSAPFRSATMRELMAAIRDAIVATARGEIGKVGANNGNVRGLTETVMMADGTYGKKEVPVKHGWQTLKTYLGETVVNETLPLSEIKASEVKAGGKNWCGIFGLWCLNKALIKYGLDSTFGWNTFKQGPINKALPGQPLLKYVSANRGVQKGDIVVATDTDIHGQFENHHLIVADNPSPGGSFPTIEGNYYHTIGKTIENQAIVANTRSLGQILHYLDWSRPNSL